MSCFPKQSSSAAPADSDATDSGCHRRLRTYFGACHFKLQLENDKLAPPTEAVQTHRFWHVLTLQSAAQFDCLEYSHHDLERFWVCMLLELL